MSVSLRLLLSVVLLLGISSAILLPAQLPPNELEIRLGESFKAAGLGEEARFGAFIVDAGTGEHLARVNITEGMTPASLVKLFTAAAALDVLGPTHTFRTTVLMEGEIDAAGQLNGRLIIKGAGDPALGSRFQQDRKDVTKLLRDWTSQLQSMGLKSFEGSILGDDRLFEGDPLGRGWDPAERAEWWSAEVAGLTFNDGCIAIEWDANRKVGTEARYTLIPATDYVQFTSTVKVTPAEQPYIPLRYFRHATRNEQVARGNLPRGTVFRGWTAVEDPARFTAALLAQELTNAKIKGNYRGFGTRGYPESRLPAEEGLSEVLSYTSPPLASYLSDILADSQNLYAESIARAVALKSGKPASFDGAAQAITEWAERKGFVGAGFALMDGSGLSVLNMLSPRSVGDLLLSQNPNRSPDRLFRDALAVAGESGTLQRRLAGLEGRFQGKTGVLKDATSLAGYLRTQGGRDLVVVLMIDRSNAPVSSREQFIDSLVLELDQLLSPAVTASR
jgi:D-alanyl-D-alanine carboxypeptidase/D-alanyl-D-alanine-endopeptidase (penicillin-binding protein 4)